MKKLLFIICLIFTISSYSQTTRKYNNLLERYEFYNSSRQLVGYAKYNSLQERWEFFNNNNQMYAYSKYNSLTGETEYIELNTNTNNSSVGSGRYIVHDYGEPSSLFDADVALLALQQRRKQYEKAREIYNNLTPEQRKRVDEYIDSRNKKRLKSYVKLRKDEEGKLFKHTIGIKNVFDEFINRRYELMYQLRVGKFSRIEFSFGYIDENLQEDLQYESFRFGSSYQLAGKFIGNTNIYGGLGLVAKKIEAQNNFYDNDDIEGIYGLASSNIGFEYNFNFPLVLFIDYEFALTLVPSGGIGDGGFGLGLRYGFN